jgi:hypothetical protein
VFVRRSVLHFHDVRPELESAAVTLRLPAWRVVIDAMLAGGSSGVLIADEPFIAKRAKVTRPQRCCVSSRLSRVVRNRDDGFRRTSYIAGLIGNGQDDLVPPPIEILVKTTRFSGESR